MNLKKVLYSITTTQLNKWDALNTNSWKQGYNKKLLLKHRWNQFKVPLRRYATKLVQILLKYVSLTIPQEKDSRVNLEKNQIYTWQFEGIYTNWRFRFHKKKILVGNCYTPFHLLQCKDLVCLWNSGRHQFKIDYNKMMVGVNSTRKRFSCEFEKSTLFHNYNPTQQMRCAKYQ